jgi:Tol biopolymer transport system component
MKLCDCVRVRRYSLSPTFRKQLKMAAKVLPRQLVKGQTCQIWVHDITTQKNTLLFETDDLLLEAPNWTLDGADLILNGNGLLWRLPLAKPALTKVEISGVPPLNNDHVLDPDGEHIYLSSYDDWQLYRAPLQGGKATRISGKEGPENLFHFLHGVSPDGKELAFVGVEAEPEGEGLRFLSAQICTLSSEGTNLKQLTTGDTPKDGPEYSPDGQWIYFNTEAFTTNAQIARMRRDGSDMQRLTNSNTVDWFPHISPDGSTIAYLAYPPATRGHPANLNVELMVVRNNNWTAPRSAAKLFGGQGTINVNSWSPTSTQFAYIAYPFKD